MFDTVVISGEDDCCSVVFGTLVGVFVFNSVWSDMLMIISVRVPERGVCIPSLVRTEYRMFVMCCMQCCMSALTVL